MGGGVIVAAVHDLFEALSSVGITIEAHGDSLRYRPRSAMTPDMLAAVKNCKADLLDVLKNRPLFLSGLGVGGQCAAGVRVASNTREYSTTQPPSKAEAEWDRFLAIAIPTPDGLGLFDPVHGVPEMPRGVAWEDWQRFENDCSRLGRGGKI